MANKFDVPPVQSTGILMQGLGQGLVEFGNVYGATKLATIEAEAQRNKEMRIMQMENIRNNMNDAFRYASYENDQARLDLARNADARAELAEGRAERSLQIQESAEQRAIDSANKSTYTEVKIPVYQVKETPNIATGAVDVTSVKVGERVFFVNKNDPSDVFKMENGNAVKVSAEEVSQAQSVLVGTNGAISAKPEPVSFETIEEAKAYIKSKNDSLSGSTLDKYVKKLVDDGFFVIEKPTVQSASPINAGESVTAKNIEPFGINVGDTTELDAEYGSADNYGYGEYELPPEPPAVVSDVNPTSQSVMDYMAGDYYSGDEAFKVENNNGLISDANDSQGVMSRKDVLPIMEPPPQEIVSPDDAMLIQTPEDGLLMQNNESATMPDLGTGAYGEMPLDQPTNVSGPRLPTGDTGYIPPDNADMQYPQARQQAISMVEAMKDANLPEDVIRSELLRLIQEIPQEKANSAYAQALVDVFNQLFSGNN